MDSVVVQCLKLSSKGNLTYDISGNIQVRILNDNTVCLRQLCYFYLNCAIICLKLSRN